MSSFHLIENYLEFENERSKSVGKYGIFRNPTEEEWGRIWDSEYRQGAPNTKLSQKILSNGKVSTSGEVVDRDPLTEIWGLEIFDRKKYGSKTLILSALGLLPIRLRSYFDLSSPGGSGVAPTLGPYLYWLSEYFMRPVKSALVCENQTHALAALIEKLSTCSQPSFWKPIYSLAMQNFSSPIWMLFVVSCIESSLKTSTERYHKARFSGGDEKMVRTRFRDVLDIKIDLPSALDTVRHSLRSAQSKKNWERIYAVRNELAHTGDWDISRASFQRSKVDLSGFLMDAFSMVHTLRLFDDSAYQEGLNVSELEVFYRGD